MRALERFYGAAIQGDLSAGLAVLKSVFDVAAVGVSSRDSKSVVQHWIGLEPEFDEAYVGHYHRFDPWVEGVGRLGGVRTGECLIGSDLVSASDRRRNVMVQELCNPFELGDLQVGLLHSDSKSLAAFSMMRSTDARPFGEDDRAKLETWLPHVRTAQSILALRDRTTSGSRVSIVVDGTGRMLDRDPRSQPLFACGALVARKSILHLRRRTDDARLHAMLRAIVRGERTCGVLSVKTESLDLVVVRPAPFVRGAIVEFLAPNPLLSQCVKETFGLSNAESELAIALLHGATPKEIAARRRVAVSTIRTQLRSVFAKTHTTRQPDLVALLLRVCS